MNLFLNGERGAWYDPSDLTSLFQESIGTTQVTAVGQPVGLALDKRFGLVRGANAASVSTVTGVDIGGPALTQYPITPSLTALRNYEIFYTVSGYSGTGTVGLISGTTTTANGTFRSIMANSAGGIFNLFTRSTNTANFSAITVREVPGSDAVQATAASRPLVLDTPRRIEFDGVDDSLVTPFSPALGTDCTVGRSIPGSGAQILTAQNIGTTFTDSTDSCAIVIINRALTAFETARLTDYLNGAAGL